ncbi:hypothetical protein [Microbacterium sp. WCS2018Hpa-23]|uniref:hypothetical protein n=1 Tax=Microbacterium sp. WCS2018Hpa-23 TaxID=3073634 RepID=UPI0028832A96|nr:hypothetical protein [Microbacterium sp. WCS2018Hpa-23]
MTDELTPNDQLFYTIKELKGWYELLELATDSFHGNNPSRHHVGRLISTILLAAGEDLEPIAISGALDENGTGDLTLVYPKLILRVTGNQLKKAEGTFGLSLWQLADATDLAIEARHNYFDGTHTHPRSRGIQVRFTVGSEQVTLCGTNSYYRTSPALQDEAFYAAFLALREAH